MFALLHSWTTESNTKIGIDSVRVEIWPWHSEPSYGQCSPLVVLDIRLDHTRGTYHLQKVSHFTIFFSSSSGDDFLATAWEGIETRVEIIMKSFVSKFHFEASIFFLFCISCCCCCCRCHTLIFVATSMCLNMIGWLHVLMLLFKMFLWRVI